MRYTSVSMGGPTLRLLRMVESIDTSAHLDASSSGVAGVITIKSARELDTMARAVGPKLAARWGQQVLVDNRPGAGGAIAAELVAKTQPELGAKGTSLILVEGDRPGFRKGRKLEKMGQEAADTAELFFDNVRLPADKLLGGTDYLNKGFVCLMEQLPWERLQIAIGAVAAAQAAIDWTVTHVKDRKEFGQPVASFQNTRFTLAELQTEVQVARVFVDKCTELLLQDKLDTATASMAKYWCSDLQCKVMDECVQLFGGYGYMWEYPITRAYADARVQRIYGGTNEIMKEVITRAMGLGGK